MFVRFDSAIAGANFSYAPGDVVDWPNEAEAARFVERGIAEELSRDAATQAARDVGKPVRKHKPKAPEAAVRTAPESAELPRVAGRQP